MIRVASAARIAPRLMDSLLGTNSVIICLYLLLTHCLSESILQNMGTRNHHKQRNTRKVVWN